MAVRNVSPSSHDPRASPPAKWLIAFGNTQGCIPMPPQRICKHRPLTVIRCPFTQKWEALGPHADHPIAPYARLGARTARVSRSEPLLSWLGFRRRRPCVLPWSVRSKTAPGWFDVETGSGDWETSSNFLAALRGVQVLVMFFAVWCLLASWVLHDIKGP